MTKERMIELLEQAIVKQNKLILEDRKEKHEHLEIVHQGMRNGLVLARVLLSANWENEKEEEK